MVVAVDHTAGLAAGDDPARLDVPDLELLFDAALHALARDHATQHAARCRQRVPFGVSEAVYRLEKDRAVVQQRGSGLWRGVLRPLQARVADVYRQKRHARM